MMADARKLEKTGTPGIYRRHNTTCRGTGRCRCPYVVRWKAGGKTYKQMCPTWELAKEQKAIVGASKGPRRPQSSKTIREYWKTWLPAYRGRTARGLTDSTRREYRASFEHHIDPLPIARIRMRDLTPSDVREWCEELERRGVSPRSIKHAKIALGLMFACAAEDSDVAGNPVRVATYIASREARQQHPQRKRRRLTADDVVAILAVMSGQWRAFFMLLAQTGMRIGELLGLTWEHVHLGDDPHIMVIEQVYRGERKQLKTDASEAKIPISASMASWLAELRPEGVCADAPVFASRTGGALTYANVYNRVLRPALVAAGLAVKVGETAKGGPIYDYQGIAFHAFRHACGSLLLAHGKTPKQVQGWLRHSQLTTTMNVYIHQVDDGLGSADAWESILGDAPGRTRGVSA